MYRSLRLFVVLCAALVASPVIAIPAGTGITNPHASPLRPFDASPFALQTQTQIASTRGPFTWLRDTVIERLWGIDRCKQSPNKPGIQPRPEKSWTRYGTDIVLRIKVHDTKEAEALAEAVNILFLDVWDSTDQYVDIRLAKEVLPSLLGLLPSSLQKSHTILIEDLSKLILESQFSNQHSVHPQNDRTSSRTDLRAADVTDLFFEKYQPFSVILQWMRLLTSMFPSHTQLINVGMTHEGRDIPAFRLGARSFDDENSGEPRKTIMIMGGSHAREWISTSTVAFIAFQMITEFGKSLAMTKLLEKFDWILVPTINPDGYIYSWEQDRLWRKNRQPTGLSFCPGIDLDRSWGYEWDGQGARSNPCSESYAGDSAFDGIETRTIAEWAHNQTQEKESDFIAVLDLHSYSQQILYPYSYSCSIIPPSLENLEEVAFGLAKAIRMTNQEIYTVRSACEGAVASNKKDGEYVLSSIESTSGSALDWFYHELNAKYSYQIKLRDRGMYGFILPPAHIIPTGHEIFNSVLLLGHFLLGEDANDLNLEFLPGSVSGQETRGGLSQFMDNSLVEENEDGKDILQEDPDYFSAVEDDTYKDEGWGLW